MPRICYVCKVRPMPEEWFHFLWCDDCLDAAAEDKIMITDRDTFNAWKQKREDDAKASQANC